MKLLFAIKSLNVEGGGAERVLVDVVNGLSARGHDVKVLTFDSPGKSFYRLDRKVERMDACFGEPGVSTSRLGFLRSIPRLRQLVSAADPDLVIAFMHSTYVPLALSLLGSRYPLVVSEHVDARHYDTRPLQRLLVAFVDRMALAKTVPSQSMREACSGSLAGKVHVLPNSIDLDAFRACCDHEPQEPPVLLSVGRLMEEKGHVHLIRAYARLSEDFPDWSLRIVGDGVLRPQLEAEIDRLRLREKITMPGATTDVASQYASASIVVLPSLYESFGLVAGEALACGRPVVAFDDCGGISEMVRDGENGMLIPPGTDRDASLATGMRQLMQDSALRQRLSAAGPASVEQYAIDRVVDSWEQFLTACEYGGS